jgi:hypothetical protein
MDTSTVDPSCPRTGASIVSVTIKFAEQKASAPLSPQLRGERMKVRGPNQDFSNFIAAQDIRCSGALTAALLRECPEDGNHSAQREDGHSGRRASRNGRTSGGIDSRFRGCRKTEMVPRYDRWADAAYSGRTERDAWNQASDPFTPSSRHLLAAYRGAVRERIDSLFRGNDAGFRGAPGRQLRRSDFSG